MPEDPIRRQLAETAIAADLRAWRRAHPEATLTEIERTLDARLSAARADLLADVAGDLPDDEARCPTCGARLVRRGERTRTLRTQGDAPLALTRSYRWCPACDAGVPPLDERLGLLPGRALTPWLSDSIVRLGTAVPFAHAAELLVHFTGVRVGAETVRRLTEAAGAAQVARETAAVAELERTLPEAPPGPAVQLLSVDGAMVPLVGGEWREVKTLALGEVVGTAEGPRTVALSYFSRMTDAATFGRLATAETHRRGTTTAGTVVAVPDGAAWCQGFIDLHRFDAVRILDFPHAVEHLGAVAQTVFGSGTAAASDWLGVQAHRLRHGQEDAVLATLAALGARGDLRAETRALVDQTHTYLATRREHIRYAHFTALGYPIGSGCVESANKLVVEARLKGPGMHWDRATVDPLLALRTLLANGRWDAEWTAVWAELRTQTRAVAQARRSPPPAPPARDVPAPGPLPDPGPPRDAPPPARTAPPKLIVNGTPTKDHPWKRGLAARAHP